MSKLRIYLIFLVFLSNCIYAQEYGYIFDDPSFCNAQNFYIRGFGGANFLEESRHHSHSHHYATGFLVSGAIGFCSSYGIRFEGEYAFRRNTSNKLHIREQGVKLDSQFCSSAYMANLYWDIPLFGMKQSLCMIQPYVGAGVGCDCQRLKEKSRNTRSFKWKHKGFAWQLMTGLEYMVAPFLGISVEYKYHHGSDKFYYTHAVGLGLEYWFSLNSLH